MEEEDDDDDDDAVVVLEDGVENDVAAGGDARLMGEKANPMSPLHIR